MAGRGLPLAYLGEKKDLSFAFLVEEDSFSPLSSLFSSGETHCAVASINNASLRAVGL